MRAFPDVIVPASRQDHAEAETTPQEGQGVMETTSQDTIGRLQGKLQAFYDDLDGEEKAVVSGVLLRAAGEEDVAGHLECECGAPPAPAFSTGPSLSIHTNPADPNSVVVIPL